MFVALALTSTATASAGGPKLEYNARDQTIARAGILRLADFNAVTGWRKVRTRPDRTPQPTCANFRPDESDLVLTGVAASHLASDYVQFASQARVFATAGMVRRDWQRTMLAPGAAACGRKHWILEIAGPGPRTVSFARMRFPKVAPFLRAYRFVFDVKTGRGVLRFVTDVVLVAKGRTAIRLIAFGRDGVQPVLSSSEQRFVKTLLRRART